MIGVRVLRRNFCLYFDRIKKGLAFCARPNFYSFVSTLISIVCFVLVFPVAFSLPALMYRLIFRSKMMIPAPPNAMPPIDIASISSSFALVWWLNRACLRPEVRTHQCENLRSSDRKRRLPDRRPTRNRIINDNFTTHSLFFCENDSQPKKGVMTQQGVSTFFGYQFNFMLMSPKLNGLLIFGVAV